MPDNPSVQKLDKYSKLNQIQNMSFDVTETDNPHKVHFLKLPADFLVSRFSNVISWCKL